MPPLTLETDSKRSAIEWLTAHNDGRLNIVLKWEWPFQRNRDDNDNGNDDNDNDNDDDNPARLTDTDMIEFSDATTRSNRIRKLEINGDPFLMWHFGFRCSFAMLSPSTAQRFFNVTLSGHPTLQHLKLQNVRLTTEHAIQIANALLKGGCQSASPSHRKTCQDSIIKSLFLGENDDIGPEGTTAILQAIRHHKFIQNIDLSSCKVDVEGFKALDIALGYVSPKSQKRIIQKKKKNWKQPYAFSNCLLKLVVLDDCIIDTKTADKCMEFLARGLMKTRSLEVLCLTSNHIGNAGCLAIAHSLKRNRSLRELHLQANNITGGGGTAIAAANNNAIPAVISSLRTCNYRLERLHLEDNECLPPDTDSNNTNSTTTTTNSTSKKISRKQRRCINLLCKDNKRRYQQFKNLMNDQRKNQISASSWPYVIEVFRQKPDLIYMILKSKIDICLIDGGKKQKTKKKPSNNNNNNKDNEKEDNNSRGNTTTTTANNTNQKWKRKRGCGCPSSRNARRRRCKKKKQQQHQASLRDID